MIFWVTALAEVIATLPEGVPEAELVKRTYMVVVATTPLVWVNATVAPYPEPEEVETSKPVGAVTVMLPVK